MTFRTGSACCRRLLRHCSHGRLPGRVQSRSSIFVCLLVGLVLLILLCFGFSPRRLSIAFHGSIGPSSRRTAPILPICRLMPLLSGTGTWPPIWLRFLSMNVMDVDAFLPRRITRPTAACVVLVESFAPVASPWLSGCACHCLSKPAQQSRVLGVMVAQALVDGLELWWGKYNFSTTKSVPLLTSFGPLAALSPSQCWCNSRGQEGSPTKSKGNSTCKSWAGWGIRRGRWGQSQPQAPNRTKNQ